LSKNSRQAFARTKEGEKTKIASPAVKEAASAIHYNTQLLNRGQVRRQRARSRLFRGIPELRIANEQNC
jgi:hypothetical protein